MSVASVPSTDTPAAIIAVAEALQPYLAQGFQVDALRLRLEMEQALGRYVGFGGATDAIAADWTSLVGCGSAPGMSIACRRKGS